MSGSYATELFQKSDHTYMITLGHETIGMSCKKTQACDGSNPFKVYRTLSVSHHNIIPANKYYGVIEFSLIS